MSNSTNAGLIVVTSESDKINKARNNINNYMEYVYDIKQASIHRQWHDFIQANPWGILLAPQFHGKCESERTKVLDSYGQYRQITEYTKSRDIVSYNQSPQISSVRL